MPQESGNHERVFDQRNQRQASTTPRTGEDIQPEAAAHQIRPVLVAPIGSVRRTEVLLLGVVGSRVLVGTDGCAELDYEGPPRGARRQNAVLCGALDYAERHGGWGPIDV